MTKPTVGFIGLGIMGKPMARNLLKAGYTLVIHNRSRTAVDELNKEGAQVAASAQEVASRSEAVITMLPDSPACRPFEGTDPLPLRLRSGQASLGRLAPRASSKCEQPGLGSRLY